MKKQGHKNESLRLSRFTSVILMLLICTCMLVFVACSDDKNEDGDNTIDPIKLSVPTVTLDGDTATWTAVENADKYEIDINGSLSYLASSQTSKKLADGDVFKVRAIGDGKTYMTSDWSKMVTYTVEDNSNPDIPVYTVTWKSGSTVLEVDYNVPMGTIPTYNGATPTKAADAQYSYNFSGWSPAVTEVMADVTYSAVFTEVTNSYKVVWKNGDAILETDTNVPYGTMPEYNGATPTKASNEQYSYTFSGWSPEVSVVTGDVTYRAQFASSTRIYTVTFYSDDGVTVLSRVSVSYGVAAAYSKPTPIKNATEYYVYTFDKWVTSLGGTQEASLSSIKSDLNVYASFTATVRTLNLSVITNNSNYGEVSTTEIKNIAYGSLVEINGNVLTVDGKSVTATPKISTPQYTYTFVKWDAPVTVVSNTIIKATFERTVNKYTVTWKNGDEILEIDEDVTGGSTPVYNGAIPTKPADSEFTYIFAGWSPVVAAVTGDVTYYATFTDATNKYTVTFYDDDGTGFLGRVVVEYGQSAVYPNALPTKLPPQNRPDIIYTFDKWVTVLGGTEEASLDNITENKSVYAKYTTGKRNFVVTFLDWDGSVIEEQSIAYGESAIKPKDPYRESYRFIGWDNDSAYSNITSDVIVNAMYIQQFVVEFLDYDDSVIDIQLVDIGESAVEPQAPTINNYRFTGWSVEFTNISDNLTVKAEYIRQYNVTFIDFDGTVLKEVLVDEGSSVEAPIITDNSKYSENGLDYKSVLWDSPLDNVTSDLVIRAKYTVKTFVVTFRMPDGTIIGDPQTVKYGEDAIAPMYSDDFLNGKILYPEDFAEFPKLYFDFNEKSAAYFSGWSDSLEDIKENKEIYAKYETAYEQPVIFVQAVGNTLKVQMYCPKNCYIYGLEFGFNWNGSGTIENCIEILGESKDAEYNNKNKTFKYAMFYGHGFTSENGYFDVTEITYSGSHGFTLNVSDIIISTDCSIICGTKADLDVEELSRITPIVVIK